VSLYYVASLARERVTVVLTGEGSDETLGGYARYALTLANARMDRVYRSLTPSFLRKAIRNGINASPLGASIHRKLEHTFLVRDGAHWDSFYFDNFYSAFSAKDQAQLLRDEIKTTAGSAYQNTLKFWDATQGDLLHRLLYTDIKTYLLELLMKQDQMSMAASIESRVPFLDHELVEFTARIPQKYLIRGLAGKFVLKSAVEDLLPHDIIYRQKMGFPTPWAYWLAGPQLDELQHMLLEERSLRRGFFNEGYLKQLFAEHRRGYRDHGNRIWRLLNLEIWMRVCIDGELPANKMDQAAVIPVLG
jgi:asparagine synthase (glutamine-hydrolysing)